MTKIKLCGLSRACDIEAANKFLPEYIGFVFAKKSGRYVTPEKALELKQMLSPEIKAVGVFVNEPEKNVAELLEKNIIDIAQLHGDEGKAYINRLRSYTGKPIIKAFRIVSEQNIAAAESSTADYVMFDSGAGTGKAFNWNIIRGVKRPYFLAGGLGLHNVEDAIKMLNPYAVDVSSGIETNGFKDINKMAAFVACARKER